VNYRIHPEAAAEHRRQIAYYEEKQAGLGRRYHAAFRAALAIACEAPQRPRIVRPPDIRRVSLSIFQFDLIYREKQGVVQVLAVAHHRREPDYWIRRI
jgi:toxin ParE1/3/4